MSGGIGWVVGVNLVIWTGLFLYLLRVERQVHELETVRKQERGS
jgi:CcmD family protein